MNRNFQNTKPVFSGEGKDDDLVEMSELKNVSFSDFINFAVMSVLKSAPEDVLKHSICVDNIEALLSDDIEKENRKIIRMRKNPEEYSKGDISKEQIINKKNYSEKLTLKEKELEKLFGNSDKNFLIRLKQLSSFKFRELLKFIKGKTPELIEGRI